MNIESLRISNFKCFGEEETNINLSFGLTVLIGSNGSGKTALIQALLRLFGVSIDQRQVKKKDFHIPPNEIENISERSLYIECVLAFTELNSDIEENSQAIPEFFHHMTIESGGALKCRIRLEATRTDDGTAEGTIQQEYYVVKTLDQSFEESQKVKLSPTDRGRIQVIYVPAVRDGISQITNALKGRLWKAIAWSQEFKDIHKEVGVTLQQKFEDQNAIKIIKNKLNLRWTEVHNAGTDSEVFFSPVDREFENFVKSINVGFRPDEEGKDRLIDQLSDGQRSLFHIAFATALLDIENELLQSQGEGFQADDIYIPALTILAIEEPENNLAPFYLSRIIRQIESTTIGNRSQAIISTHSPSTLVRTKPEDIRYFRCDPSTRLVTIKEISLPADETEAGKYVREAVRAYPELYFAKYVILGEGDSELIILPRLAESLNLHIDPSFVAIVPLGGRHVNHFWKLLTDLEIPHSTLLDLDLGRFGGGWGRIKNVCNELYKNDLISEDYYNQSIALSSKNENSVMEDLDGWIPWLREDHNVYFSEPLDIDMMMLKAYFDCYTILADDSRGPKNDKDNFIEAVLGKKGSPSIYPETDNEYFKWYRYLFLGDRSKPSSHINAFSKMANDSTISSSIPLPLKLLLENVSKQLEVGNIFDQPS